MGNLNKAMIIGNVGKDPELRYTSSGTAVCGFSVAVNDYRTVDGEKKQETEWFIVKAWAKLAETCNQFVVKGMLIYVEGSLKTHSWDSDGIKRYQTELIAQKVQFLSKVDNAELKPVGDEELPPDTEPEDLPF